VLQLLVVDTGCVTTVGSGYRCVATVGSGYRVCCNCG
jgi:hypothetical protein